MIGNIRLIVLPVLIFLTPAKLIYAQYYWGVKGGVNQNSISTDISNRAFTETKSMTGINIGLIVKHQFKDWLSLQVDPNFITKNYSINRTGIYEGIYQSYKNSYFQLPVSVQVNVQKKNIVGFLCAGVYGAYWAFGKIKGAVPNILDISDSVGPNGQIIETLGVTTFSEKYEFDSRKDRRFEFGWLADVGIGYIVNEKYNLFIEARYYHSISDQQKPYMENQVGKYNNTPGFSVGILIPFDNKK